MQNTHFVTQYAFQIIEWRYFLETAEFSDLDVRQHADITAPLYVYAEQVLVFNVR